MEFWLYWLTKNKTLYEHPWGMILSIFSIFIMLDVSKGILSYCNPGLFSQMWLSSPFHRRGDLTSERYMIYLWPHSHWNWIQGFLEFLESEASALSITHFWESDRDFTCKKCNTPQQTYKGTNTNRKWSVFPMPSTSRPSLSVHLILFFHFCDFAVCFSLAWTVLCLLCLV